MVPPAEAAATWPGPYLPAAPSPSDRPFDGREEWLRASSGLATVEGVLTFGATTVAGAGVGFWGELCFASFGATSLRFGAMRSSGLRSSIATTALGAVSPAKLSPGLSGIGAGRLGAIGGRAKSSGFCSGAAVSVGRSIGSGARFGCGGVM